MKLGIGNTRIENFFKMINKFVDCIGRPFGFIIDTLAKRIIDTVA